MDLEQQLYRAASAQGLFLKTHDAGHRAALLEQNRALADNLERLRLTLQKLGAPELLASHAEIAQLVERFLGFEDSMIRLTQSAEANTPALALAGVSLNPHNRVILQASSEMLVSEAQAQQELMEELATAAPVFIETDNGLLRPRWDETAFGSLDGRIDVLETVHQVRYSWSQVVIGLRGFLAYREQGFVDNIQLFLEKNAKALRRLRSLEALLTFEQADALERSSSSIKGVAEHLQGLVGSFRL